MANKNVIVLGSFFPSPEGSCTEPLRLLEGQRPPTPYPRASASDAGTIQYHPRIVTPHPYESPRAGGRLTVDRVDQMPRAHAACTTLYSKVNIFLYRSFSGFTSFIYILQRLYNLKKAYLGFTQLLLLY